MKAPRNGRREKRIAQMGVRIKRTIATPAAMNGGTCDDHLLWYRGVSKCAPRSHYKRIHHLFNQFTDLAMIPSVGLSDRQYNLRMIFRVPGGVE